MIEAYGAVSPEVAAAMARGAVPAWAPISISATGVAGPAGGTPEKPVGLVYLGLATAARSRRAGWISARNTPRHHPAPVLQGRPQLGSPHPAVLAGPNAVSQNDGRMAG